MQDRPVCRFGRAGSRAFGVIQGGVDLAQIENRLAIELAEQQREIAVAQQSGAVSAAQGEAEVAARKLRAAADETRYAIDAAGRRALYEAENLQTPETVALRTRLAVIERLEGIIRESGKPLERIEEVKIVLPSGTDGHSGNPSGSLSDQVVSSALRYRTQAPLIDALLNDLGIPAGGSDGLLRLTQDDQGNPPA